MRKDEINTADKIKGNQNENYVNSDFMINRNPNFCQISHSNSDIRLLK